MIFKSRRKVEKHSPNGETRDTEVLGDVIDDERAEANVGYKSECKGRQDEHLGPIRGRLDQRRSVSRGQ